MRNIDDGVSLLYKADCFNDPINLTLASESENYEATLRLSHSTFGLYGLC
jgi:hypothetical protein